MRRRKGGSDGGRERRKLGDKKEEGTLCIGMFEEKSWLMASSGLASTGRSTNPLFRKAHLHRWYYNLYILWKAIVADTAQ